MGERGPVPKRSDQRRRKNKTAAQKKAEAAAAAAKAGPPKSPKKPPPAAGLAKPPAAKATWHPAAKAWYAALKNSGQSNFYEPSDWAVAYLIAESISRDLKPQVVGINEQTGKPVMSTIPMKGASLSAYLKAMTSLLVTEGDRRRAGLELERASLIPDTGEEPSDVADLDDYRARLGG